MWRCGGRPRARTGAGARGLLLAMLTALTVLGGCAALPTEQTAARARAQTLLHDERFAPPAQPVEAAAALRASDAMRQYLKAELAGRAHVGDLRLRLIDALRDGGRLRLEYDAALTRSAAEAFDARAGNCLSLVLMTSALARELGLRTSYQTVLVDQMWTRSGDLYFANGHVNLTLARRMVDDREGYDTARLLTVDFLPPQDLHGLKTVPIDESTVLAMYLNNRAAETLARGLVDEAYWWARAALLQEPRFVPAFNTLGVVYLRHRDAEAAEQVLRHVLQQQPEHRSALANLAQLLAGQGRAHEADALRQRLARLEPQAPFAALERGFAALRQGDALGARRWFDEEAARQPDSHEAQFGLAVAQHQLGDGAGARLHLQRALASSTSRQDRQRYAAKLEWLRAHAAPDDLAPHVH